MPEDEYLYVTAAEDVRRISDLSNSRGILFIVWEKQEEAAETADRFADGSFGTRVLIGRPCSRDYLMNRLIDVFYSLTEWDKNMHVAALEGQGVQHLLDIREDVLAYPTIAFDGTFDVVGYTRHIPCEYHAFQETVHQGYTDSGTMSQLKKKQIFTRIQQEELLIAPAADDDKRINIYLQFFSNQSLLGYLCIYHEDTEPEGGYVELIRLFMQNMSLAMKKNYETQRHGQMMYETFLYPRQTEHQYNLFQNCVQTVPGTGPRRFRSGCNILLFRFSFFVSSCLNFLVL
ncbi:MAG: hypothetical protein LUG54_00250 [Clostridiales bacterium]|nr:hypothetical protein [Clostridiales bacterium]